MGFGDIYTENNVKVLPTLSQMYVKSRQRFEDLTFDLKLSEKLKVFCRVVGRVLMNDLRPLYCVPMCLTLRFSGKFWCSKRRDNTSNVWT